MYFIPLMVKLNFSQVTPVFSVTLSRNHSNILIWCLSKISNYVGKSCLYIEISNKILNFHFWSILVTLNLRTFECMCVWEKNRKEGWRENVLRVSVIVSRTSCSLQQPLAHLAFSHTSKIFTHSAAVTFQTTCMSKPYCFTIKFPWKIIQASHKCQTRKNIANIKQGRGVNASLWTWITRNR